MTPEKAQELINKYWKISDIIPENLWEIILEEMNYMGELVENRLSEYRLLHRFIGNEIWWDESEAMDEDEWNGVFRVIKDIEAQAKKKPPKITNTQIKLKGLK